MLQEVTIDGHPGIVVVETGNGGSVLEVACRRCLDVVLATMLLLLLSPLLLLIALLIKFDTAGSVIFVQERVGARRRTEGGRTVWEIQNFQIYKFRTMVRDADQTKHQAYIEAFVRGLERPDVPGPKFKLTNDLRVTRAGRMLRKTSLDELPQLVNVLRGEMSLVGPRPVPTYEVAAYQTWHCERLAALPGITGLWQVNGRGRVSFEEMIRLDIDYVRNQSLWLYLKILLLTIPAVLAGRGAE